MSGKRIGIIGGGAKAAALCSKVACLRKFYSLSIEVTVFEQSRLGAAWTGQDGYTDGHQQLCTPAERDVGYPYSHASFGAEVAREMHSRFSWSAFAVESELIADWVDRGRPPPTHIEFAKYVEFCVDRSDAHIVYGTVNQLAINDGKWDVRYTDKTTSSSEVNNGFDALVVTGAGPAANRLANTANDPRIFNGVTFWQALDRVATRARSAQEPIVIVGSGGTAAATAGWLARLCIKTPIIILGNQAALYTRNDNVFENRAFRNADIWESLSPDDRRTFTDRLTRGTVWSNVVDVLAKVRNVEYRPGRAKGIRCEPPDDPTGELFVEYTTSHAPRNVRLQPASLVIDATGFDATFFTDFLPDELHNEIRNNIERMRQGMKTSLRLPLAGVPPLHVPGLSQVVSPAFTSLMALGDLADAVLRPYVKEALS